MKYISLIWTGLWRKTLRTTFTLLSLIMAFLLFGLLQSVNAGLNHIVASAHEDRLFTGPRFGPVQMPMSYVKQLESLPGVSLVTYQMFLNGYVGDPKNFFFVGGVDENYLELYPEIPLTPEQRTAFRNTPNGIILSVSFAKRLGLKAGDRVPVISNVAKSDGKNDWAFEVIAITDRSDSPGSFQFSYGSYRFLNEQRATNKDTVSQIEVRVEDKKTAAETVRTIDAMFENSSVSTRSTIESVMMASALGSLGNVGFFVTTIVSLVMFVLLLLTATTMIQSVNERATEFGVLKTLGFSNNQVLSFIFAEALVQCLLGAAVGLVGAQAISPVMQGRIPGPPVVFNMPWWVLMSGMALAILVAFLSAALPAWRIARLQLVDALAGR